MISGRIISTEKETVDFATVYLKGTSYGGTTNQEGLYHIKAPAGDYTLVVSAVGYTKVEKKVKLVNDERMKLNITIAPETQQLDEVTIVSTGVSRVKRSAFNAVAVDTKELQNTTKNLSDALTKAPGMKLRESGGVGSDMQLMLDGFSGKHVKVFIDGVPQEGVGSSFSLNNIPVSFADRIEVYKGVVPVGFGTEVKRRIMLGSFVLSSGYYDAYYLKALRTKALIKKEFDRAFEKYDMILSPAAPSTAPRLGESLSDPLQMYLGDIYTVSVNLAGLPGITVPCGMDDKGLPIGMQLIGDCFSEKKLFRAAYTYEQARGAFGQPEKR